MTVVEARQATRRFGSFTAVDRVDLEVDRGEVVGILGANGAGKTTLIRMVLGLLVPSDGVVRLFGETPSRRVRSKVGYVPQSLGLWRDLTAAENLAFAAEVFGVEPTPAPNGVGPRLVGDLPLGLQRQVAFAAALQHRPALLVLDEPTSGVAPLARARLWDTIRAQAENGTTVIVTTHYMDEARQADRLVLMAAGTVIGRGQEGDIVAGVHAVTVEADRWDAAFAAIDDAGLGATVAGRTVRVAGSDVEDVTAVLRRAGVDAMVSSVPATLEEAMVVASTS